MDSFILRSGPASVNTIGDNMDCDLNTQGTVANLAAVDTIQEDNQALTTCEVVQDGAQVPGEGAQDGFSYESLLRTDVTFISG